MAAAEKSLPLREVVEITVPPSVRARVSTSGGSQLTANRALARSLETVHRVAHRILVRKETARPTPPPLSPEEKLLRAMFGDKATDPNPQLEVVTAGEQVKKWGRLVKTVADGEMHFTSAEQGEVEKVEHVTAGLPRAFAGRIEVIVRWTSPLTVGDELLAGKRSLGVITAIVDDGASEPVLTVDGATGDWLRVTRALPTALQRMSARSIGPYSIVTQRPVTGETITDEELAWLAHRGCLALFGDFAAYKGDPPERRIRVYERLVTGEPIVDPWSEWQEGQLEKERRAGPAPARSDPAPSGVRDIFSFFEKPGSGDQPATVRFGYADSLARVAGISLVLEGHSVLAQPALPVDASGSHGLVTKPETLDYRTLLPTAGGLFCQKIFGPVKDYECACGKLKRMKFRGMVCESCGVECIRSSVRRQRFGHIELPSPVVPFHLRPLLGALLDAGPAAAVASVAADGGKDLSARLAAVDPVWRSASLLASDSRRPLLDAFAASGMAAKDLLWHRILVLPPDLRPLVPLDGGRFATSDLNDLYRRVINRANRLSRLLELAAPEVIIVNERAELQKAVDQLLFNGSLGKSAPKVSFQGRMLTAVVPTLLSVLRGDRKRRTDYSGRAVAVVDPALEGEVVAPAGMLFEIARPLLYGLAEKAGHVTTIKSAKKLMEENVEIRRTLMEPVYRERPLLVAGSNGTLGAAFARAGEDPVIRIGPGLAGQLGVETGGEATVHLPISDPAVEEARRLAGGATSAAEPVAANSWMAELPRSAVAAAERLIEVAFEKLPDDAMHPSVALLVGGYEILKH